MPAAVSVVIPCYGQTAFLGEAIESAVAQRYPRLDIVVVDDGSPDDPGVVTARFPEVRLVRQENRGLSGARNTGIRESHGDYLVFLDADDRLLPDAVPLGVRLLDEHPGYGFVAGRCRDMTADGVPLGLSPAHDTEADPLPRLLRNNSKLYPCAAMYRRTALEAVGGFDVTLRRAEDWDINLRIARIAPVLLHNGVVAEYRRHGGSLSGNSAGMLASTLRVLFGARAYARREARYATALEQGIVDVRRYFGTRLLGEARACLRAHDWAGAARRVGCFLRYCAPTTVRHAAGRRLRFAGRLTAPIVNRAGFRRRSARERRRAA